MTDKELQENIAKGFQNLQRLLEKQKKDEYYLAKAFMDMGASHEDVYHLAKIMGQHTDLVNIWSSKEK